MPAFIREGVRYNENVLKKCTCYSSDKNFFFAFRLCDRQKIRWSKISPWGLKLGMSTSSVTK